MLRKALDELEAVLMKTWCQVVLETQFTDSKQKDLMQYHLNNPSDLRRIGSSSAILIPRVHTGIDEDAVDAHWRSEPGKLRPGWKFRTARLLHQRIFLNLHYARNPFRSNLLCLERCG